MHPANTLYGMYYDRGPESNKEIVPLMPSPRIVWAVRIAFLFLVLVIGLLYAYGQTNPDFLFLFSNASPPFLALSALIPAALVVRKNGFRRAERWSLAWLIFALGLLLWFFAETIWAYFTLWLLVPIPYPSIADAFWLSGYPFFMYSLFLIVWPFKGSASRRNTALVLGSLLILAIGILAVLIPPILEESDVLTVAVDLAYPLLDISLLSLAVPALLLFRKGYFWKPMLFVVGAIALSLVGDILFSWATLKGYYYTGHPLELFFLWSYLAFSAGFYLQLRQG